MLHSASASNWVDRGAPPDRKVVQLLAHFLALPDAPHASTPWLDDAARDLIGMVLADASEQQVAGYLRALADSRGAGAGAASPPRLVAIALWHVVKAAEVRDRAERVIAELAARVEGEDPSLANWLAERLLSPAELAAHRQQRAPTE